MNEVPEIPLRVTTNRKLADEWALVLVAEGLSPSVWEGTQGVIVGVPPEEVEQATNALLAYESENPAAPPVPTEWRGSAPLYAALVFSILLLDFFFITDVWGSKVRWIEIGAADAALITRGEWWRTITALTLHADLKHVLGNVIAGAILLHIVCRATGPGLGSVTVLAAGAGGNLVNAFFYGSSHISIGASTAVFGALGLMGGIGVVRRRRHGAQGRQVWVPIVAGLAILAMLGTAGERVDLLGHLFGFLVGGGLGIVVGMVLSQPPEGHVQWVLAGMTIMLIGAGWGFALG
ncbi:MAG: rhomboid family intramembrane serine protease [Gammaproteobacteria bacterium]|jgi:membrane associated rhomboid family serine protease|nr:rhomboid family intramembrane serine protease [Gammaproteobacteria bacterium]